MKHVLRKLIDTLDFKKLQETSRTEPPLISNDNDAEEAKGDSEVVTHAWLWPRVGQWLKARDVVIADT